MSLTPSQVADRLGCRPRDITMLFYDRLIDVKQAPIVRGRRQVPVEMLPELKRVLLERGKITSTSTGA